uniref:F-box domain-containing protein n=1 Tax=Rhabditophanes sp. KR3021 TaxID=114890 RepID=A0AC35U1G7_9BILA
MRESQRISINNVPILNAVYSRMNGRSGKITKKTTQPRPNTSSRSRGRGQKEGQARRGASKRVTCRHGKKPYNSSESEEESSNEGVVEVNSSVNIKNFNTVFSHEYLAAKIIHHLQDARDRYHLSLVSRELYTFVDNTPIIGRKVLENYKMMLDINAEEGDAWAGAIGVSLAGTRKRFVFANIHDNTGNFPKVLQYMRFVGKQVKTICVTQRNRNYCRHFIPHVTWLPILIRGINREIFPNIRAISFDSIMGEHFRDGDFGELVVDQVCFHGCEFGRSNPFIFPASLGKLGLDSTVARNSQLLNSIVNIRSLSVDATACIGATGRETRIFQTLVNKTDRIDLDMPLNTPDLVVELMFKPGKRIEVLRLSTDGSRQLQILKNLKRIAKYKEIGELKKLEFIFVNKTITMMSEILDAICDVLEKAVNLEVLRFFGKGKGKVTFGSRDCLSRIVSKTSKDIIVLEISVASWVTTHTLHQINECFQKLQCVLFRNLDDKMENSKHTIQSIVQTITNARTFVLDSGCKKMQTSFFLWIVNYLKNYPSEEKRKYFDVLIVGLASSDMFIRLSALIKIASTPRIMDHIDLVAYQSWQSLFTISYKSDLLTKVRMFLDSRCPECLNGEEQSDTRFTYDTLPENIDRNLL